MLLDVRPVRNTPGALLPFAFTLELSALDFFGERPLREPVEVDGALENRAGVLTLHAHVRMTIETLCARCAKPLHIPRELTVEQVLADTLANEENDDIVLLDGDAVDADEIFTQAIILDMDRVHLCSPDCRGLCPRCGADLNEGPCDCGGTEETESQLT